MKVKNEYIIIKNGNKQIKLQNLILNKYLDLITENQTLNSIQRNNLEMESCYLKFDEPLEFDGNSTVTSDSFDITFAYEDMNINSSNKQIEVNYLYTSIPKRFKIFDISNGGYIYSLEDYIGRKITAIGFGLSYFGDEAIELYACVDTRNYNLYIEDVNKLFSISRRDIFSTDANFYCPSKLVDSPIHLFSKMPFLASRSDYGYFAVPVSIGLGLTYQTISEEHSILPYSEHIEVGTRLLKILDELNVTYSDNGLYPSSDLSPSENLWPARKITEGIFPSLNVYPGETVYPLEVPYQYVQIKYEIFKITVTNTVATKEDTGQYYLISIPINGREKIKTNIYYERA